MINEKYIVLSHRLHRLDNKRAFRHFGLVIIALIIVSSFYISNPAYSKFGYLFNTFKTRSNAQYSGGQYSQNDLTQLSSASDNVFIDHIFLFSKPGNIYNFSLPFEKNHKYAIEFSLKIPDVTIHLSISIDGPDGDHNGFPDHFDLAEGSLSENSSGILSGSNSVPFGCGFTGIYNITMLLTSDFNGYIYIKISDQGEYTVSTLNSLNDILSGDIYGTTQVLEVIPFYNLKTQAFYLQLIGDTAYRVSFFRVTPFSASASNEVYVSISMYNSDGLEFPLMTRVPLFEIEHLEYRSFAVSDTGEYIFEIRVETTVPTVNCLFAFSKMSEVGDGPEDGKNNTDDSGGDNMNIGDNSSDTNTDSGANNSTNSSSNNSFMFGLPQEIVIPDYIFLVLFGTLIVFMGMLFYYFRVNLNRFK